jgi:hypothetical protein
VAALQQGADSVQQEAAGWQPPAACWTLSAAFAREAETISAQKAATSESLFIRNSFENKSCGICLFVNEKRRQNRHGT